jgi:hypothetical protein
MALFTTIPTSMMMAIMLKMFMDCPTGTARGTRPPPQRQGEHDGEGVDEGLQDHGQDDVGEDDGQEQGHQHGAQRVLKCSNSPVMRYSYPGGSGATLHPGLDGATASVSVPCPIWAPTVTVRARSTRWMEVGLLDSTDLAERRDGDRPARRADLHVADLVGALARVLREPHPDVPLPSRSPRGRRPRWPPRWSRGAPALPAPP